MLYLFLATLCSASIALIFKYSEGSGTNRYAVTSANYFVAFMTSAVLIFSNNLFNGILFSLDGFREIPKVLRGDQIVLSTVGSITWAILLGSFAGVFFFLSFVFYQKSVKENGASISGTFAKLGILIPMIFSIILWKELPSTMQWIGIGLALLSIVIVNYSKKSFMVNVTLIMLFVFGGFAEFSNKIYQKYALNDYKDVFLFFVFFIAFWISLFYTKKRKSQVQKRDLFIGLCVGIPNLFSSYFLILALESIKTSIVFPVYSAGSIVLISFGSWLIFRETMTNKQKFATILTLIALVLINI